MTRSTHACFRSWVRAIALAAVVVLPGTAAGQESARFRFGEFERALTGLSLPSSALIVDDGTIYIAESAAHRIVMFNRAGDRLDTFGMLGEGEGQLRWPTGIALDQRGRILVADSGNDRIAIFDRSGTFIAAWGERGNAAGEFCQPRMVAAGHDRIIVTDTGNQRVQVLDHDGAFLFMIEGSSGDARFRRPVSAAFDHAGRIVVVDADRASVHVFDDEGKHVRSFGDYGPFVGLLNEPMAIVCAGDEMLVVDSANHRVQFFNERGEANRQWGVHDPASHEGNGRIHYPHALAIGGPADAPFAVICEPVEHRCQIFRAVLPGETQPPRVGNPGGELTHFGARLAIDGRLLLIPEPEHHFIYVLDLQSEAPVIINQFGHRGSKPGQFVRPGGVIVSERDRRAVIIDASLSRLQEFALDFKPEEPLKFDPFFAKFVRSIDFSHERFARPVDGLRWPLLPETAKRSADGLLHVLDSRNAMVFAFDAQMKCVRAYGEHGGGQGQLREPSDLAFSPDGSVTYIVDQGNFRVQAFDAAGSAIVQIGGYGDGDGMFLRPFGIAVDEGGAIYVSDELQDCVQKFSADGTFIARWGMRGVDHGEFWRPMGLAFDDRGRLFVIDHGNHRAQMFSSDGEWLGTFGAGKVVLRQELED